MYYKNEKDALIEMGVRIRTERKRLGCKSTRTFIEQYECDFSQGSMDKWESGSVGISVANLIKLCGIFQCDADYLLGLQEHRSKVVCDIGKETGLSEKAIEKLKEYISSLISAMNKVYEVHEDSSIADTISMIKDGEISPLETKIISYIIENIYDVVMLILRAEHIEDTIREIKGKDNYAEMLKLYEESKSETPLYERLSDSIRYETILKQRFAEKVKGMNVLSSTYYNAFRNDDAMNRKQREFAISDTFMDIVKSYLKGEQNEKE